MVQKSFEIRADAVIYDLEDAVPAGEKTAARELLSRLLDSPPVPGSPRRFVRLNHPSNEEAFEADLACAAGLHLEGVGIPKVERPEDVRRVEGALAAAERAHGLEPGIIRLMLLIESPLGLINAFAIASASPRIIAVAFGAEDFSREMGLPLVKIGEAKEQLFARSTIAIAAAAAGVQSADVIWTDLGDLDGLAAEAAQARRLGFTSKQAIHPDQADPINTAFSPTDDEVKYATEVLEAYEAALAQGTGALNLGGRFIEEPIVARARHTMALATVKRESG